MKEKYHSKLLTTFTYYFFQLGDRNVAMARHLREAVKHVYVSATKDLNTNSQNLYKTQAAIQVTNLANKLFCQQIKSNQTSLNILLLPNCLPIYLSMIQH